MSLVGHVFGLVENFNIGNFSDTVNVITVNLCRMVLHIALYLSIAISDFDVISRSQQCQASLTESFMFLTD